MLLSWSWRPLRHLEDNPLHHCATDTTQVFWLDTLNLNQGQMYFFGVSTTTVAHDRYCAQSSTSKAISTSAQRYRAFHIAHIVHWTELPEQNVMCAAAWWWFWKRRRSAAMQHEPLSLRVHFLSHERLPYDGRVAAMLHFPGCFRRLPPPILERSISNFSTFSCFGDILRWVFLL